MNLEIVLVRHGQSIGNRDRIFVGHGPGGLTDLGHRQAHANALALAARPVDAIYCSDLARAVDTAAPLATRTGLAPILDPALRERDIGTYTGLTFEEVMSRDPDGWAALLSRDADHRPPSGESHRDCLLRVSAFFDTLCARHTTGRVVLVSHAVAINHMLRHVIGLRPDDNGSYFQVENASQSRLTRRRDHVQVLVINDTAHLAGLT